MGVAACSNPRAEFIGTRVKDTCGGEWPICSEIAGCLVGDKSYLEGRFPGKRQLGIQLFEPSTVKLTFLLDQVSGAGEQTALTFFEERCRSRVRVAVSGRTFVGEAEQNGTVFRSADLSGVGDHLLEVESDSRANYLLKVDITPLRLKSQDGT